MEVVSKTYDKVFDDVKGVSTVDGVRLEFEDGWVLIRSSGTEPIIRITVEARAPMRAQELLSLSAKFVDDAVGGRP